MLFSYLANLDPYQELIKFNQLLVKIPTDLTNKEALEELQIRAALAVKYSQVGQAYKLLKQLQRDLFKQNQETKDLYEPILVWLHFAAMPDLAIGELADFFKQFNFTIILKDEDFNDLAGMLRLRLALEDINERDALREKIYNALHGNEKLITEFSNSSGPKTTIASWLKLYDGSIGLDPAASIAIAEFKNQNAIAFKLDEDGKTLLKRLVDFYEYVKLSSSDTFGFEEDIVVGQNGANYLLSNGEQIDLARAESEAKPMQSKLVAQPAEQIIPAISMPSIPNITKQSQSYLISTNGETPKVISELQKSIANGNILGATGALVLLAQLRRLDDILIDEPSFLTLVAQDLEKSGQAVQREGLNAKPNAPQFLARFLKVLLQDNLHINPDEAMKFTERLGELLVLEGEAYKRLIAVDEKGLKRWNM